MLFKIAIIAVFTLSSTRADFVYNNRSFPSGFKFGAATASYQIEGAWNEDGKGENLWDWYTHTFPERITNRDTGDVACDSYRKWKEDIQLLKGLGVNHYRFSLSWSRILPNGTINNVNQKGIDYYISMLETLKANNIEPMVTLFHWDLPLPFHEMGGWLNPLLADYFADYARLCYRVFGKYVKNWITINEPQTTCVQAYGSGGKAPGYKHSGDGVYQCAFTHVLAHAKAYHVYDKEFRGAQKGRVSIVLDSAWAEPASTSPEDKKASQTAMAFSMGLYAHPIYNGNWPSIVIERVGNRSSSQGFARSRLPQFSAEEIKLIKGTSDFFCLNSYSTYYAQHQNDTDKNLAVEYNLDIGVKTFKDPSWHQRVNWVALVPWGFRNLINYVWNDYGKREIIITENGWADVESILDDTERITYLSQYLSAVLDAYYIDKVNVTGYTTWSLLDNFEWTNGYSQKLGLVQVDFNNPNRTRTVKSSYNWYKGVISRRCLLNSCVN